MAKPVSYRNLDISRREEIQPPPQPEPAVQPPAPMPRPPARAEPEPAQAGRLRERAQAYMVYVNPEAAKTIAEFALARSSFRHKVKAHDVWLQANGRVLRTKRSARAGESAGEGQGCHLISILVCCRGLPAGRGRGGGYRSPSHAAAAGRLSKKSNTKLKAPVSFYGEGRHRSV